MEVAVVALVLGVAIAIVARVRGRFALIAAFLATTAGAFAMRPPPSPSPPPERPKAPRASTYVGSAACRGCHPSEHASFSRTFHRTMTQDATPQAVLARTGEKLDPEGHALVVDRDGVVWAAGPGDAKRVVLATGSHREQAYWVAGGRPGELSLFPFVWLVRERQWMARRDAFVTPPDRPLVDAHWNSSCIACHAVAGEPGHERDDFDTRAAELGVACEACHGPGAAHVAKHRDPVTRYVQYTSKAPDPTIVHPKRLPAERSAAICGQCHSYAYPRDEDDWWAHGYARAFRAGDALEPSRILLSPAVLASPRAPVLDTDARSLFWDDGAIRVGGREYNGLVESPCWQGEGERKITCISCHAMHAGDPSGQIAPDRTGDRACTSCHATTPEHSHHAAGSPGARCVACHMPKTSYALLSAVRSHRIETPHVDPAKPSACNLCHLDKSLAWTSTILGTWYRAKRTDDADDVPYAARAAFAGDAAERVIVADALGSAESRAASGEGWQPRILAELVSDPYAAVRFVAARSLRAQPGFADLPAERAAVVARSARAIVEPATARSLLDTRDTRAVTIAE
ncbi:MAG TPA: multiheme c-type cytochrome [Labilithrix sp.]